MYSLLIILALFQINYAIDPPTENGKYLVLKTFYPNNQFPQGSVVRYTVHFDLVPGTFNNVLAGISMNESIGNCYISDFTEVGKRVTASSSQVNAFKGKYFQRTWRRVSIASNPADVVEDYGFSLEIMIEILPNANTNANPQEAIFMFQISKSIYVALLSFNVQAGTEAPVAQVPTTNIVRQFDTLIETGSYRRFILEFNSYVNLLNFNAYAYVNNDVASIVEFELNLSPGYAISSNVTSFIRNRARSGYTISTQAEINGNKLLNKLYGSVNSTLDMNKFTLEVCVQILPTAQKELVLVMGLDDVKKTFIASTTSQRGKLTTIPTNFTFILDSSATIKVADTVLLTILIDFRDTTDMLYEFDLISNVGANNVFGEFGDASIVGVGSNIKHLGTGALLMSKLSADGRTSTFVIGRIQRNSETNQAFVNEIYISIPVTLRQSPQGFPRTSAVPIRAVLRGDDSVITTIQTTINTDDILASLTDVTTSIHRAVSLRSNVIPYGFSFQRLYILNFDRLSMVHDLEFYLDLSQTIDFKIVDLQITYIGNCITFGNRNAITFSIRNLNAKITFPQMVLKSFNDFPTERSIQIIAVVKHLGFRSASTTTLTASSKLRVNVVAFDSIALSIDPNLQPMQMISSFDAVRYTMGDSFNPGTKVGYASSIDILPNTLGNVSLLSSTPGQNGDTIFMCPLTDARSSMRNGILNIDTKTSTILNHVNAAKDTIFFDIETISMNDLITSNVSLQIRASSRGSNFDKPLIVPFVVDRLINPGYIVTVNALSMFAEPSSIDQPTSTVYSLGELIRYRITLNILGKGCLLNNLIQVSLPASPFPVDITRLGVRFVGEGINCFDPNSVSVTIRSTGQGKFNDLLNARFQTICSNSDNTIVHFEVFLKPWMSPEAVVSSPVTVTLKTEFGTKGRYDEPTLKSFTINPTQAMTLFNPIAGQALIHMSDTYSRSGFVGKTLVYQEVINLPNTIRSPLSEISLVVNSVTGDDVYVFSINDFRIIWNSEDLGILTQGLAPTVYTSTKNNWQMDTAKISLGNLVIPDLSKVSPKLEDYSSIRVAINLTIADSLMAVNGTSANVTLTTTLAGLTTSSQTMISVTRGNDLRSNVLIESDLLDENSGRIYAEGDKFTVRTRLRMREDSTSECRSLVIYLYYGSFMTFNRIVGQEYKSGVFSVTPDTTLDRGVTKISGAMFFFGESAWISYEFSVLKIVGRTEPLVPGTFIAEGLCVVRQRTPPITELQRTNSFISYSMPGVVESGCEDDLQLNNDIAIKDCQMTATYEPIPGHDVFGLRMKNLGWWAGRRAGDYSDIIYATIQLGHMTRIKRISTMAKEVSYAPLTIKLAKSDDGVNFYMAGIMKLSYRNDTFSDSLVPFKLSTRAIRIYVLETKAVDAVFKIALFGCKDATDAGSYDPCAIKSISELHADVQPIGIKRQPRTLLIVDDSLLLFCDLSYTIISNDQFQGECFRVSSPNVDGSTRIKSLGSHIAQLLRYSPKNKVISGLSNDYNSLVISNDDGETWTSITKSTYDYIQRKFSEFQDAIEIPYFSENSFSGIGGDCTKFAQFSWRICFDGIYYQNKKIIDWAQSCARANAA